MATPYYLWKGRRTGKYRASFKERAGTLPDGLRAPRAGAIWLHAVSVGEVIAARALVLALQERMPERPVFVSTSTVTGQDIARRTLAVNGVFFAPFDFPRPVRAALDRTQPALLVLMETEIWPNLIHEASRRGVRVAIVNGRISPRSFPRYRRLRPLLRHVLAEVDLFLMQGEAHANRVRAMGAPPARVAVSGNLKFDALPDVRPPTALARLLAGPGPLLIAGSTVAGEELLVLRAFTDVRSRVPGLRLLIAPRHPERFSEVAELAAATGLRVVRRSVTQGEPAAEVVILDTLGELAGVYALADVVFVGGSLMPSGGHNVLEAAASGKPVVVGPHMENFQEIADQFTAADALVQVPDGAALGPALERLLLDEPGARALGARGQALLLESRGALARTVDALYGLLA